LAFEREPADLDDGRVATLELSVMGDALNVVAARGARDAKTGDVVMLSTPGAS
jgi:hypothetical protein